MRVILALAALVLAGVAIYNGDASRGRITFIEQTQEPSEVETTGFENATGYPSYVPHTTVCTWRQGEEDKIECRVAPRAEYRSHGRCIGTEWAVIEMLAADAERRGLLLAATVVCVAEYDA